MDTEKYIEIQKKLDTGKSPSDEGPYYHHAWWESYKGGVKGKFGGVIIGASVGGAIGALVAGAAAIVGTGGLALPIIGSFAAAGLLYGAHEFSEVGKVTGAASAVQQQAELRMKAFEEGKFAEIKQEICALEEKITGKPVDGKKTQAIRDALKDYDDLDYRKTHYAKLRPVKMNTFAFWKVSLVGLVIGALAGIILGQTGVAAELFSHIGGAAGEAITSTLAGHATAISALVFGAMGASFGLNRDFFRRVFDKTDLWFKGLIHPRHHEKVRVQQEETGKDIEEAHNGKSDTVATAVMPEGYIDYPASSTYHRDKVLAAAEKALLSFDHTRATPQ